MQQATRRDVRGGEIILSKGLLLLSALLAEEKKRKEPGLIADKAQVIGGRHSQVGNPEADEDDAPGRKRLTCLEPNFCSLHAQSPA